MGRRLTFGSGAIRVSMDDGFERLARRALDRVAPGVLDELDQTIDRLEAQAISQWPVKTGTSRAGISSALTVEANGTRIRASLLQSVPYSVYIKAKNLAGKSPVVELLRRPIRAEAAPLARRLASGIKKILTSD